MTAAASVAVGAYVVAVGLVAWFALVSPSLRRRDPFDGVNRRNHALEVMASWRTHPDPLGPEARRHALLEADEEYRNQHGEVEE